MEKNHENPYGFSSFLGTSPKKAVTSIVATVLLLMMTVAAAGLAYKWIMDTQNMIQIDAGQNLDKNQARTGAKLTIDSMWKDDDTEKISFILRNSGSYTFADVSKFSLYVDGKPATTVPDWGSGGLSPGSIITVSTDVDFVTTVSSKTIKVVTDLGTEVPYRCEIPIDSQEWC